MAGRRAVLQAQGLAFVVNQKVALDDLDFFDADVVDPELLSADLQHVHFTGESHLTAQATRNRVGNDVEDHSGSDVRRSEVQIPEIQRRPVDHQVLDPAEVGVLEGHTCGGNTQHTDVVPVADVVHRHGVAGPEAAESRVDEAEVERHAAAVVELLDVDRDAVFLEDPLSGHVAGRRAVLQAQGLALVVDQVIAKRLSQGGRSYGHVVAC